jgi:hypothetical protein
LLKAKTNGASLYPKIDYPEKFSRTNALAYSAKKDAEIFIIKIAKDPI